MLLKPPKALPELHKLLAFSMSLASPVLLDKLHDTSSFDCGVAALNEVLRNYALVNQ